MKARLLRTSRCSSNVLLVYGRVGLVEDGRTLSKPQTTMMSGACPPPARAVSLDSLSSRQSGIPAPSVWYVCIVRPPKAAMVPRKGLLLGTVRVKGIRAAHFRQIHFRSVCPCECSPEHRTCRRRQERSRSPMVWCPNPHVASSPRHLL